jgi:opacity protein-like surface antigen
MFKKSLLAVIVLGSMATAVQAAEQVNGYLFGSLGQSEAQISNISDDTDTAWKVGAGVQLNPYVGVEFQYVDLGMVEDRIVIMGVPVKGTLDTTGLGANVVGTLPLDRFSLFGKLGYHQMKTDANLTIGLDSGSGSEKEWLTSYGVGAAYRVADSFDIVAEYERYQDVADEYDVDLLSAGLRYNF